MIGLGATLYTLLVPGALITVVPWLLVRDAAPALAARGGYQHLGWLPALVGVVMIVECTRLFVRRGRGTPAPSAPPTTLVASGLFAWTRNPMYVGVILVLLGEAMLLWSPSVLLCAGWTWMGMEAFLQWYEEPSLRARFGAAYDEYARTVPRWVGSPWWWSRRRGRSTEPPSR